MFWGCFSYDKKGPCHIWKDETAAEKKEAQEFIDKWNSENEARLKQEWDIATGIRKKLLALRPDYVTCTGIHSSVHEGPCLVRL